MLAGHAYYSFQVHPLFSIMLIFYCIVFQRILLATETALF